MNRLRINASRNNLRISAEGTVALVIGLASLIGLGALCSLFIL